jgi:hypothetical protein
VYIQRDNGRQFWAVSIAGQATLTPGLPEVLFEGNFIPPIAGNRPYDVTPDRDRFVMIKRSQTNENSTPQINVVLNWSEELTERVPVP